MLKPIIPIRIRSPVIGPEEGALMFKVFKMESLAWVLFTPLLAPAHHMLPTIGMPAIPFNKYLIDQLFLLFFDMTIWFG